ncbi:LacI family DNA-binding transcriptional regulator [Tepidibacillus sp. HK-1]|uniref:LacI family DNA-binding transcriptional regulator n=1 Tax=Tepidibacillus sp. HK-1 TaxID=1883407 RepID=UPI000853C775|nr:LacI family DNA-binding transcriptional regulator [Tepidibacillus sp. HK-1]GBF12322.1 putative HTH-type transcriptional repressor ExuR [Tepidibacillus sp. HK-1]
MATIKDIAKAAGVSVTTVSRALNGYDDVNEKTRAKIKAISEQLNYSPNFLARSLVMNKTKTIGLLVSGLTRSGAKDNFLFEVLSGINDRAGELGYDIVLFSTTSSKQQLKTYTQLCRERRVDGVILAGIKTDDPYLQEVVESEIPVVLIDVPVEGHQVGYVTTDNIYGAKKAVQYLAELGHRNIGIVNGHDQAFVSRQRLEGYKQALVDHDIPFHQEWVINGQFLEEVAKERTLTLLTKHPEITALFCASDLMAIGVIKAAKELGRNVPEDLSVIGYDDIILASYSSPSLTTISQDKYMIGYEAATMIVHMLEEKISSHVKVLDTQLITRESTAKPINT